MSVRRKLFFTMAAFIISLCIVFILVTQLVVRAVIEHLDIADRSTQVEQWSDAMLNEYQENGSSWPQLDHSMALRELEALHPDASVMLLSPNREKLYRTGEAADAYLYRLGIEKPLYENSEKLGTLYYHDAEQANISMIQLGVSSSVSVLLIASTIVFLLLSLLVAYLISRRLTAPLQQLIPALQRLGKGELGIQAPVTTKDEYGLVAQSFNQMSLQLQQAEQLRRNLVADVAHELRTPITIVRGQLDLVQQTGQAIAPESLLPLQDELIRLTRMVEELHQLSLAEARKLPLEIRATGIADLLQRIVERVALDAKEKDVAIQLECPPEPLTARIDPHRITQVILNLLMNAIRHTSSGDTIKVAARQVQGHSGMGCDLLIEVSDSGSGIAPEHLPHIFERFYRSDEARSRSGGGMGLGLAIAREFIMAHGGTLEVSSTLGQGTTFSIKLPMP